MVAADVDGDGDNETNDSSKINWDREKNMSSVKAKMIAMKS